MTEQDEIKRCISTLRLGNPIYVVTESSSMEPVDNGSGVLFGRSLAAQIPGDRFAFRDGLRKSQQQVFRTNLQQLTSKAAFSILSAYSFRFMCLSIMRDESRSAVGLASPLPIPKCQDN